MKNNFNFLKPRKEKKNFEPSAPLYYEKMTKTWCVVGRLFSIN